MEQALVIQPREARFGIFLCRVLKQKLPSPFGCSEFDSGELLLSSDLRSGHVYRKGHSSGSGYRFIDDAGTKLEGEAFFGHVDVWEG